MTVVRDQLFPQKPPGSRFRFSRTGVQPSPGSSTIELPSAFAESGAYPPDREPPGSPRQCSLPLACRHPPEGHQIGARKRRTPENTILSQPYCRRVSTDRSDREGSQLAASLEGEPGPTPAGKTLPHSYPETRFRRERAWIFIYICMSLRVFLFAKKMKFLTKGGIHCVSQVFPWHFYFMREHSLVELTEHDDSAANIIVHSTYTYVYCCIHSTY